MSKIKKFKYLTSQFTIVVKLILLLYIVFVQIKIKFKFNSKENISYRTILTFKNNTINTLV